ncbi:leucyl aminopeptidase [Candidatus Peregrinibacteria bacterium]|nr:MAG: leucyl aminopeptidase [Candidatus Peregrinibacteria bacterium]
MKLLLQAKAPKADLLFLALYKKESLSQTQKECLGVDKKTVEDRLSAKDFEGEEGQSLTLFTDKGSPKRIILLGRGDKEKQMPQSTEYLGATMAKLAKTAKAKSAAILCSNEDLNALSCGFVLGHYEFTRYKKKDPKAVSLEQVSFVSNETKEAKKILERTMAFMHASNRTRDLINTCAGDLNTEDLAQAAVELGKKYKLKTTVFDDKKLKKMGCGGLYGMGQGATVGSRMVILEYRHKSKAKVPALALVGKGIVYDTGGMNFKPSGHIEDMKLDMSGAATVMGTLQALSELHVPGYFVGVLCIAENALSERAIHSGDAVSMYNGKTVEITNTDAEGRMVLGDGLAYVEKNYKPKKIINVATLTGAVTVALGYTITGVLGNNDAFIQEVLEAGKAVKERQWPLPLDEDFVKATKGSFTDLQNSTDGIRAGTIMGAAFLKNFVDHTPWVHLDIAGTAWVERPTPTTQYGATSASLRTLIELAIKNSDA